MLLILKSIGKTDITQLYRVYEQTLSSLNKRTHCLGDRQLFSQMEFYEGLQCFYAQKDSFCAIWAPDGRYEAALRIEPYRDGFLISWLETAMEARRKGYATMLLSHTISYLNTLYASPVYSHVEKTNIPSLKVHLNNGFNRVSESAVFLDGSVFNTHCTLVYDNKKPAP